MPGIELSERAYDRPSLKGLVQHQKAPVAFDFEETTPQGEDYIAHLYEGDLAVPAKPGDLVTFTPTNSAVQVEMDGLGLVDAAGEVTSLGLANRDGLQTLGGQQHDGQVLQNAHALPRAFVLPRAQAFSPARHAELTPTQLVANADVDLHRMVLIENDPTVGASPNGDQEAVPADAYRGRWPG